MKQMKHYWETVRANVCARCIDGDGRGNCRLSSLQECAVRLYFPGIVEAILSVQSEHIGPYVDALRATVCSCCRYRSQDGECSVRKHLECGLDRYFPLIVDAIETVDVDKTPHEKDLELLERKI